MSGKIPISTKIELNCIREDLEFFMTLFLTTNNITSGGILAFNLLPLLSLSHYNLENIPESSLEPEKELYGLCEFFFDGESYVDISNAVFFELERVSTLLNERLGWQVKSYQIKNW